MFCTGFETSLLVSTRISFRDSSSPSCSCSPTTWPRSYTVLPGQCVLGMARQENAVDSILYMLPGHCVLHTAGAVLYTYLLCCQDSVSWVRCQDSVSWLRPDKRTLWTVFSICCQDIVSCIQSTMRSTRWTGQSSMKSRQSVVGQCVLCVASQDGQP